MNKKNFFGEPIWSIAEIIRDKDVFIRISDRVRILLSKFGSSEDVFIQLLAKFQDIDGYNSIIEFENHLHDFLTREINQSIFSNSIKERSLIIYDQVKSYIAGDSLLDIGCGDGEVSLLLKDTVREIYLCDIFDYRNKEIPFPFYLIRDVDEWTIPVKADTSLLLTVMHHSHNPLSLLRNALNCTKKRIIIIESVINISKDKIPAENWFITFSDEQQRKYACFWDWFYNRVIHTGVQVPHNYLSPEGWIRLLNSFGWAAKYETDLGIDQALVPEYHYLIVADKA